MTRVYIDMVADLFHVGHLNIIKKAKKMGDVLIVGIHSDEDVKSYKRIPIICHDQRVEIVKSIKYVDEVIENAPLSITKDFLDSNKINIVVHGDDKSSSIREQHKYIIENNIIKYVNYTKGISTSCIINRIKDAKDL